MFRAAITMLGLMTILTGFVYPLAMTGLAQLLFPHQANGSLLRTSGKVTGSTLIGQSFDDTKYFWPRPSATAPFPYNPALSTGSNFGPLSDDLKKALSARRAALKAAHNGAEPPLDLVTSSGSGLDPHISPEAARYQAARVAAARGLGSARVLQLIEQHTAARALGFLGDPGVNVLELNLALDTVR